jgi:lambda family phage minor tail protein L
MSDISSENQSLTPSSIIPLFTLDASSINGPVLHFTMNQKAGGQSVVFDGVTYAVTDIEFDGLETSGLGSLPTPKIRIASQDNTIQALGNTYGDLNGCVLKRIRTYKRFLDGEPDADPTAFIGPDVFRFERKTADSPDMFEWELSAAIDQEGAMFPGRVVVANTCMWRYRVWNPDTETFDYSKAQCPYTGAQSYDINNNPVSSGADDVPSRDLKCCKTRFGADQPLPFGGFPGAARIG